MKTKVNSLKQQRVSTELEGIIEEFGNAMRTANKGYIATPLVCGHQPLRFTPKMQTVWFKYVLFCLEHPNA